MFEKPLIIGASISADWAAASPGKRLCLSEGSRDVRVHARSGQPGWKMLSGSSALLSDRSIVIGLDLFFWDSVRADVKASIVALDHLVAETAKLGVPLVIGDVPGLMPELQPGRAALNAALRAAGARHKHVHVLPLEDLFMRIMRDGHLIVEGREYSYFDLVPDGLHIGERASEVLAQMIRESLRVHPASEAVAR